MADLLEQEKIIDPAELARLHAEGEITPEQFRQGMKAMAAQIDKRTGAEHTGAAPEPFDLDEAVDVTAVRERQMLEKLRTGNFTAADLNQNLRFQQIEFLQKKLHFERTGVADEETAKAASKLVQALNDKGVDLSDLKYEGLPGLVNRYSRLNAHFSDAVENNVQGTQPSENVQLGRERVLDAVVP